MSAVATQTSEQRLGFPEQPPDTCPIVEEVEAAIRGCLDSMRKHDRMGEEELRDTIMSLENDLTELLPRRYGFSLKQQLTALQRISENAAAIRSWGQAWKDYAKQLEQKPPQ